MLSMMFQLNLIFFCKKKLNKIFNLVIYNKKLLQYLSGQLVHVVADPLHVLQEVLQFEQILLVALLS